jgi:quercetin dioxygenase-like cupin family protein
VGKSTRSSCEQQVNGERLQMNRRAFVGTAVGAMPMLMFGKTPSAQSPGKPHLVRAGASAGGDVLQLGDRSFLHFKVGSAQTGGAQLLIEQSQLRRFGPPRHVHFEQDEWFYPLEGTFRIDVGEEEFELKPGDFLFAPRGVPHVWKHLEEEPGRMLVAFLPAGKMESFFRRFTQGGAMPAQKDLPALFAEHGMQVVGPPL